MRKYYFSLIVVILVSCNNFQQRNTEDLKEEKLDRKENSNDLSKLIIQFDTERIWLLSNIYEIDEKILISIIQDYIDFSLDSKNQVFINGDYIKLNQKLDSISNKHNISKKIIAQILYEYEYGKSE